MEETTLPVPVVGRESTPDFVEELPRELADLVDCGVLANQVRIKAEGSAKDETHPLAMGQLVKLGSALTDQWPRRVGDALFACEGDRILPLHSQDKLFAWFHSRVKCIDWQSGNRCIRRSELFERLRQIAPSYEGVHELPHFPPMPDYYYHHTEIMPGSGEYLERLVDRFLPATAEDRELIRALFVTMFWGGAGGARPLFLVTSDYGRGAGKTALARYAAQLGGGMFEFTRGEDVNRIKTRLLTSSYGKERVILIDNIKADKLSWADLEALITSERISGHRLFHGEGRRVNDFVWILTMNGPSVCTDIASRAVVIKLGQPKYVGDWDTETQQFISDHRQEIIRDIAAFFQQPRGDLGCHTRWTTWANVVLRRLINPDGIQAEIIERQRFIDGEKDDALRIEEGFERNLVEMGYSGKDQVHIPSQTAADWMSEILGDRFTATKSTQLLRRYCNMHSFRRISVNRSNTHGRGFIFCFGNVPTDQQGSVLYDLDQRKISQRSLN